MKTLFLRSANQGITLIEVLVIILIAALVMMMILPMRNRPDRSPTTHCLSNLKQIDLGFLMYADDNNGKFSIQTSVTNGGTMEFLDRKQTFPHYQKLAEYIRYIPLFVCPKDKDRQAAADYQTLDDTNLSYFLNADVSTNNPSKSILAGDRNLQVNGHAVPHGTAILATNLNVTWTRELHLNFGVLGFADGHADICRATNLNSVIWQQNLPAIRLSVP